MDRKCLYRAHAKSKKRKTLPNSFETPHLLHFSQQQQQPKEKATADEVILEANKEFQQKKPQKCNSWTKNRPTKKHINKRAPLAYFTLNTTKVSRTKFSLTSMHRLQTAQ